jgi:hypothetical protein
VIAQEDFYYFSLYQSFQSYTKQLHLHETVLLYVFSEEQNYRELLLMKHGVSLWFLPMPHMQHFVPFIRSFIVLFHQSHQGYKICLMDIEPVTVVIYTCFIKSISQINNRPSSLSYLNIINTVTIITASIYQKTITTKHLKYIKHLKEHWNNIKISDYY